MHKALGTELENHAGLEWCHVRVVLSMQQKSSDWATSYQGMHQAKTDLTTFSIIPGLKAGLSSLGVPWHTQILADQLTLFQPGGTDYAHLITTAHPDFQTFRRPCL